MPRYNSTILNYYNDNSRVGSFNAEDENIGTGIVGSPSCGDVMKLQIKIEKEPKTNIERIVDAKILVFGCGSAKASSSYVAQQLIGKTVQEAKRIKNTDIAKYLGLPKVKLHCSVLAESAIQKAIEDYNCKKKSNSKKRNNEEKNNEKKNNKAKGGKKKSSSNVCIENDFENGKLDILITDDAIDFVKKSLLTIKKKVQGIKLFLSEGHCGLMYKVRYLEDKDIVGDCIFCEKNGLKIYVNKSEFQILNGTKIEYKEEGLKRGLIFTNPRETGRCNCGLNFFTKETTTKHSKDQKSLEQKKLKQKPKSKQK